MPVTTIDDKRRATLPGAKPGETYSLTSPAPGRYLLVRLKEPDQKDAPLVKLKRGKDGRLYVPMKVDRATIARIIREERDSR